MPSPALLRPLARLVLAGMFVVAPSRALAQDTASTANLRISADSEIVVLTLRDGARVIGRVVEVTPAEIRIATSIGELRVSRPLVSRVERYGASAMHGSELWPENPSRTRLLFAPTGRMLRRGEGYLSDAYIFFPSVQVGIADRFSMGGGLSLFPGVSIEDQVFYVTPKVGLVTSPTVNVSAGALVATVRGISAKNNPFGIGYVVSTFGGEDASITTGAGFGFAGGTAAPNALLMFGGERRVSRTMSLVTENYLLTGSGSEVLLSGGLRFMGESLGVDFAFFTTPGMQFPIPYIAFIKRW